MPTLAGWAATQVAHTICAPLERTTVVKRTVNERARTWVVDYSAARARAIRWLGDRYLLAKPVNASDSGWRRAHWTLLDSSPVAPGPAKETP